MFSWMLCNGSAGMPWKTSGETIQPVAVTHLVCLRIYIPPETVKAHGQLERLGIPK